MHALHLRLVPVVFHLSSALAVACVSSRGGASSRSSGAELNTLTAQRSRPVPSWHRLYFVVSFTIGLLALAEAAPRASAWRHLIEFLAVVAIFGGMALWVRANRAALAEDDGCSCAEREIEIRMVHAPRSATRPSGEPEQAEVGYEIVLAAGHDGPVRGFSRSNLPSASPRA